MLRFLVICGCLIAVARAGVIGGGLLAATAPAVAVQQTLPAATLAVPTISATSSNIIRGIGNLAAISTYSKSVNTPFSSVTKADVRVNNPGIVTAAVAPAPAVEAPVATIAAPSLLAGPALATGLAPLGLNGLALNGLGTVKVL